LEHLRFNQEKEGTHPTGIFLSWSAIVSRGRQGAISLVDTGETWILRIVGFVTAVRKDVSREKTSKRGQNHDKQKNRGGDP